MGEGVEATGQAKTKVISKTDFERFISSLIGTRKTTVVGVKKKGTRFAFGELASPDELMLDYDVTLQSPRKYFMPETERLVRYNISAKSINAETICESKPIIIIGIHPYDLVAIAQMDRVFTEGNRDENYISKRKKAVLVGVNIKTPSKHSFAGSMGTAIVSVGFDLMLTDLGDKYFIEIGTKKGAELLNAHAKEHAREPTAQELESLQKEKAAIVARFKKSLNFPPSELPVLLGKNWGNPIWEKESSKCLKCGTCNLVCPTCYCFDVKDINEIGLAGGLRVRTWDGCLLEDFAVVAGGENFRHEAASRYRHRFYRKGKYLFDKLGFIACVGCGRCSSGCLPDIADPVRIFNSLKGGN